MLKKIKLIIYFILIIISLFLLLNIYKDSKKLVIKNEASYEEKSGLSFEVCLINNDFINENCFKEKRSYVTSLIDYINFYYDYMFSSSQKGNYLFNYTLKASLIATAKDNQNVVYTKEDILDKGSEVINNLSNKNYNKVFKIDYQKYNSLILDFKKSYLLSLDSKLIIKLNSTIRGHVDGVNKELDSEIIQTITIPLTETLVNINDENTNKTNHKTIRDYENNNGIIFLIEEIIVFFISLILVMCFIREFLYLLSNSKNYSNVLNKLLKNYDNIIVLINSMPKLDKYKIIKVYNFNELLDVHNNTNKPILFFENKEKCYASFFIINELQVYIFKISKSNNEK